MSQTMDTVRNGVDTAKLFATLDAVKAQPAAASFQFRATSEWVSGTHSRMSVNGFYGVGGEQTREQTFVVEGDHPAILVGGDQAPTPAELLLSALAACLTAGIGNIAAARKVNLTKAEAVIEGDIDLLGILGLSDEVRNGFQNIRVKFHLEGDEPEKLRSVVEQSQARSAVFDVITNGTSVTVDVETA